MIISINTIKRYFWIILLATFTLWSNQLPGIKLPGLGTMFPLRILAILFGLLFLTQRTHYPLYSRTEVKLLILLIYGIISLIWCIDLNTGISTVIIYVTSIFTVFTTFMVIKDEHEIIAICRAISINAIIIGAMGIFESATGRYFLSTKERYEYSWVVNALGWKYPHSIFYNTNDFATFMVAMVPIFCISVKDFKFKQIFQYAGLAFCTFCVLLTNSRLCLILSICYFIWLLPKRNIKGIAAGILTIILAVFVFARYWNLFSKNFMDIINISFGDEDRIQIWANCLANTFRTWTFGVGIGNSLIANSMNTYFNTGGVYNAHNYFLEIFEEFGLCGLICFVSWITTIIRQLRTCKNGDTGKYLLSFVILYIFLTICSSSIRQAYYFWLLLALCIVYVTCQSRTDGKGE